MKVNITIMYAIINQNKHEGPELESPLLEIGSLSWKFPKEELLAIESAIQGIEDEKLIFSP